MDFSVFLCHASDDKPAVRQLSKRLSADGFSPWLDEQALLPGQNWEQEITAAVRRSDIVLVCLSRHSTTKSGFVQKEIRYALDVAEEKPPDTTFIIPAKLEECIAPDRLRRWQWVSLFEPDGYQRLKSALIVARSVRSQEEPVQKHEFLRVVIIDPYAIFRDGLKALLSTEPRIQVLGELSTGAEALALLPKLQPEVAIIELALPDLDGHDVIRKSLEIAPNTQFLVLTNAKGDADIYRALEAGARGYLFKDGERQELLAAIESVGGGKRFIPSRVGSLIAANFPRPEISERQIDVLRLIATGASSREIARDLRISEGTVNAHIKNLFTRLGAKDRTHAVAIAARRGIIRL